MVHELDKPIICGICGKKAKPATPIYRDMCIDCYRLFMDAATDKVTTLGHPANLTFYYEENTDAKEIWFAHLRKHGFIQKRGKWRRKRE